MLGRSVLKNALASGKVFAETGVVSSKSVKRLPELGREPLQMSAVNDVPGSGS